MSFYENDYAFLDSNETSGGGSSANNWTKENNQKLITLNNTITSKQKKKLERIEEENSRLHSHFEEIKSRKTAKTKEVAQIMMSIDNLYNKCINRKQRKQGIKYFVVNEAKTENKDDKNYINDIKISADKLDCVLKHMEDFETVINKMNTDTRWKTIMETHPTKL